MIEIDRVSNAPEVVRLRMSRPILGRPFYFTAAYWVDGLLVDTGCAHTAEQFAALVKEWRIEQVVNTHSHEDHIGANAQLQEYFDCPILAHPDALEILENPRLQRLQFYRRLFWGYPKPSVGVPVGEMVKTANFALQVLHTPGHSADHICLFEPDLGWLFSGDAYIGGRDRALREGYDILGILDSLKRLSQLEVRVIFSGSGTVRSDGAAWIREKVQYLEDLGEQIYALRDSGMSPRRIRRRLLGREPGLAYLTFGHFSGQRLVSSYLAEPPAAPVATETNAADNHDSPDEVVATEPEPPSEEGEH